jgi:hypothetical protein
MAAPKPTLERLRAKYAWPAAPSAVPPDDHGWLGAGNRRLLAAGLGPDTRLVTQLDNGSPTPEPSRGPRRRQLAAGSLCTGGTRIAWLPYRGTVGPDEAEVGVVSRPVRRALARQEARPAGGSWSPRPTARVRAAPPRRFRGRT